MLSFVSWYQIYQIHKGWKMSFQKILQKTVLNHYYHLVYVISYGLAQTDHIKGNYWMYIFPSVISGKRMRTRECKAEENDGSPCAIILDDKGKFYNQISTDYLLCPFDQLQ